MTGEVFLIWSGGRGAGLQDASLLLTSAFGPVYERLNVVAFGTAEAFETRAVFPADGNLAAARRFLGGKEMEERIKLGWTVVFIG